MESEIKLMLHNNIIETCVDEPGQFLSTYFLAKKEPGKTRFILNLKSLNSFLKIPHFKMEDYRTVTKLLYRGAFMTTLDLKDAYYVIPVRTGNI